MLAIYEQKTISSLDIAGLTGKRHDNVMTDCKNLYEFYLTKYSPEKSGELITSSTYKDTSGKSNKCYLLSKDSSLDLITGYSLPHRHAVNQRWQELENQLPAFKIPTTLSEALLLAGQLAAEKEALQAEKIANQPKIEFAEKVRALDGSISIGDFAKIIGTGQNRLFKKLRNDGFLMVNNHPMQSAVDRGLLVQIEQTPFTDSKGKSHPAFQTRITGKGQVYFEKRYRVMGVAA